MKAAASSHFKPQEFYPQKETGVGLFGRRRFLKNQIRNGKMEKKNKGVQVGLPKKK